MKWKAGSPFQTEFTATMKNTKIRQELDSIQKVKEMER